MNESATPAPQNAPVSKVTVFQEKAASFRVIHADGAWASVNPYRNLHIAFYSERAPIPKSIELGFDKKLGWRELVNERDVKKGWFREMEVDIVLSLEAARTLQDSLVKWIAVLEEQEADFQKAAGGAE